MKNVDVARAWKDPLYRSTLNAEELSSLPASPAGLMELSDESLMAVNGGTTVVCTIVILLTLTTCTVVVGVEDTPEENVSY